MRAIGALLCLLFLFAFARPVAAQDIFGRDTVAGVLDLRLGASDGERSWLKHGYGKTRFGGAGDDFAVKPLAQAEAVWSPQLAWGLSAVVDVLAQPGQHKGLDAGQAYLQWKPLPIAGVHYRVRAGLMYPEISLEHGGYGGDPWIPTETITPSAINSWVGEELHPVALEVSARRSFGDHELGVTAAVFQQNDTAAAILALRGWSLSDYQGSAAARLPLAKLNSYIALRNPDVTRPVLELDGRTGAYARFEWKLPSRLALTAFYYDNRGDKISLDAEKQWAWATRFWNLGARYDVDDKTWLTAQAMTGKSLMGFPRGNSAWVNIDFNSAYLLATHQLGHDTVSGRVEVFRVDDNNILAPSNYSEHGWAVTADWRHPLTDRIALLVEALHVDSTRPERVNAGLAPKQGQTTLQASIRLRF